MKEEVVDAKELSEEESKEFKDRIVFSNSNQRLFYQKIRTKLKNKMNTKLKIPNKLIEYLFLLPDLFVLLVRLSADKHVDVASKLFLGAVIAYLVSPIDFIPDFFPYFGYVDDLALAALAINQIISKVDIQILESNWSGDEDLLQQIKNICSVAEKYLDKKIFNKIKKWIKENI